MLLGFCCYCADCVTVRLIFNCSILLTKCVHVATVLHALWSVFVVDGCPVVRVWHRYIQCHTLLYKVVMNMRLMNQAYREMQEFVTGSDHVRLR